MRNKFEVVRLTVLVEPRDIRRLKIMAVNRGVSASEIVRTAVKQFLTDESARTQEPAIAAS
jgi:hypothetical protein